ncbi:MAG: hypothetical protein LJF04_00080 [Gemmatimonadetes bacterium]|nr:hypothetical protein [Gemmatimonadota bacterium]
MRESRTLERVDPTRHGDVDSGPPPTPPAPPGELPRSIPQEQLLYARILAAGMYTGLGILLITFVLYISGAISPAIPIDRLPDFWSMDVARYLEAVNTQYVHHDHILTGWAWVSALEHGDYLNFVGIVVLSIVTIICFLGILPTLLRKRDYAYAVIAVLEVVILALAASGVLTAGGH